MDDLISKQALLDAFGLSEKTRKWGGDHSGYNTMMLYEIQDVIESQPPVNPQEPTDENLHREREQAYMQGYEDASKRFRQEPCEDAISRQAVNNLQKYRYNCGDNSITCISLKSVNDLPSVNPQEPETGHWIDNGNGTISCSHCHTWFKKDEQFRFFLSCPYCKADMKEE